MSVPKMPKEYKGKYTGKAGGNLTQQRQWTDEEIKWVKNLKKAGYNVEDIANSIDRSIVSLSLKLKRLTKKNYTYNQDHVIEKYQLNDDFLKELQPKSILDLYSGKETYYKNYNVTSNDIKKDAKTNYHQDALKLICKLYSENKKYDLIDLDPFGSAYDLFDLSIKMAKKGLIITLGELGHKRWKRFDYVSSHYDIDNLDNFTIEELIKYIQKIGLRNKKELTIWKYKEWKNIGRVYFKIKETKITSQWRRN